MERVLIVEPYYGGSHQFFLEGLQTHVVAEYTLFTLPARKWKMRMQLSALWCIQAIENLQPSARWFDSVLCSSFVDVAVLRALSSKVKGWNREARFCTYFHENQFEYPERQIVSKNFHFAAINFHSALASDRVAFNSGYNAETFFAGCRRYLLSAAEMDVAGVLDQIRNKSCVLHPAINFDAIDRHKQEVSPGPAVVVWNHRWEHDKNPAGFFKALHCLSLSDIDFRLMLLGKSYPTSPQCFAEARMAFPEKIIHYGHVASYADYIALLCRGHIVVSTAVHEFFGIAVIEAVRAGCIPILPDRLSYPELFPATYLYQEDELQDKLAIALRSHCRLPLETARVLTEKFSWQKLAPVYSKWLLDE
jgi:glycosyltransferase involved in cell wall biosynthesis